MKGVFKAMAELIHRHTARLKDSLGVYYTAFIYGEQRGGTWEGWIEFHPETGAGPVLRTDRETTQPNAEALDYWASGLEPTYLQGAFARAVERP